VPTACRSCGLMVRRVTRSSSWVRTSWLRTAAHIFHGAQGAVGTRASTAGAEPRKHRRGLGDHLSGRAEIFRHGEAGLPDYRPHLSSQGHGMPIEHGHRAHQRQVQEDNRAGGVLSIIVGQLSREIENFPLRIRCDRWYVTGIVVFSRSS
jgi:hypothetical protein